MVQIGDNVLCPECNNMSRVVWISKDEKLAGIQCSRRHRQIVRGHSKYGSEKRPQTKPEKNMVFLTEIEGLSPVSGKR